jgi:hypothetical protein
MYWFDFYGLTNILTVEAFNPIVLDGD